LHSHGKFTSFGFVAGERRTGRHAIENVVHFLPVNPLGAGRDALARVRRGNLRRKGDRHDLVHAHLFLGSDFIDLLKQQVRDFKFQRAHFD